jgi:hypothetical protein
MFANLTDFVPSGLVRLISPATFLGGDLQGEPKSGGRALAVTRGAAPLSFLRMLVCNSWNGFRQERANAAAVDRDETSANN